MAGLYLHIPFCERKCVYCDFYSIENLNPMGDFLVALRREIQLVSPDYRETRFSTVFFGGGTPSLLSTAQLEQIMSALRSAFPIDDEAEITLESNPGTIDREKLRGYRAAGINRLSIGIQSFHEDELAFLGRIHDARQAEQAVLMARSAGFDNISIDLIYSLPGQTIGRWEQTLSRGLTLEPDHVSAYSLIVEDNTPLARLVAARQVVPQPLEREAEFFERTVSVMEQHGFDQYEVSNFARPGFRSKHNMNYWKHGNYLGLGPSAHSFRREGGVARRWWNIANVGNYVDLLAKDRFPVAGEEILSDESMMVERFFLGLRSDGVRLEDFRRDFGEGVFEKHRPLLDDLVSEKILVIANDTLRLTTRGYLLCDEVSARLTS
jgi:oxygen-independent coproporphyrinogen-3 oxidase